MEFLSDLDAFFCEKYANYELICGLPQYKMPKMYETKTDEYGRKVSYSLPKSNLRLAQQPEKAALLAAVKEKLVCRDFTFSFHTLSIFSAWKHRHSKIGFCKVAREIANRHSLTFEGLFEGTEATEEVMQGIIRGKFLPTKNLLFAVALYAHLSGEEVDNLMYVCGMDWDFTLQRDVVVRYLLDQRIFNADMVWAALKEYKVNNLYLKQDNA